MVEPMKTIPTSGILMAANLSIKDYVVSFTISFLIKKNLEILSLTSSTS